ncbi:hypothetical protein ACUXPM_003701 [Ralstonia sp. 151470066-2]|uniref:Uncharacterized protein n=1 Tax=Ralstonia insidiosa TaxID=190721 RepID=A0A192A852_9RALS|nr:hypothetical protein A9Y76_28465 [Ralstonia insidiosa]KMW44126.1 hypothetical protein AC240_26650 [Ralstonia sp. MD27]
MVRTHTEMPPILNAKCLGIQWKANLVSDFDDDFPQRKGAFLSNVVGIVAQRPTRDALSIVVQLESRQLRVAAVDKLTGKQVVRREDWAAGLASYSARKADGRVIYAWSVLHPRMVKFFSVRRKHDSDPQRHLVRVPRQLSLQFRKQDVQNCRVLVAGAGRFMPNQVAQYFDIDDDTRLMVAHFFRYDRDIAFEFRQVQSHFF